MGACDNLPTWQQLAYPCMYVCRQVYATWFGLTRRMHNKRILEWWEKHTLLSPLKSE